MLDILNGDHTHYNMEMLTYIALICEGDRFGLRLSEDGALEFTVNGESLGIAAENVYRNTRNTDVYAVVKHWDNGTATVITKASGIIVKHCCSPNRSQF